MLLAIEGDRAVGVAVCFQGFSTFQARPPINIHDLAVLPGSRGRGVGKALLSAAEHEARRRGCCKLTLEVRKDNPAAGLYRALRFGAGSAGGAPIQYLLMEKRLDPAAHRRLPALPHGPRIVRCSAQSNMDAANDKCICRHFARTDQSGKWNPENRFPRRCANTLSSCAALDMSNASSSPLSTPSKSYSPSL